MLRQSSLVHFDEPLIPMVDHLLQDALAKSASDIHIETYEHFARVRYRIDGILHILAEIPLDVSERMLSRLKVMSHLDIAEKRLPQDGRLFLKNMDLDIRISTCPILFGEKMVLRLLESKPSRLDISNLGMLLEQEKLFRQMLHKTQGFILVTGPTGSGKSLTLYSALQYLNTASKNISSVEDPVEIQVPGINQVNVHSKIGLGFPEVLRTFLRQDPDIIMIGEIRDFETAKIAIQAAQTGHLVLSSLHSNSARETVKRLKSMGITDYDLEQSLSLVISQRLLRKLCPHCKIKMADIYAPGSCDACMNGYLGRLGIFECLYQGESSQTLWQSAMMKLQEGNTSYAEIHRVIDTTEFEN